MKRKILFFVVLSALLAILAFMGYKTQKVLRIKKDAASNIQQLPALPFQFLDSLHDISNKSIVVNYFSPDCDHCQYMVKQMISHKDAFTNTRIIMITPAKIADAMDFKNSYNLGSLGFVNIGVDSSYRFFKIFGSAIVPSFYIYNAKHQLVKSVIGETKIENIIKALR